MNNSKRYFQDFFLFALPASILVFSLIRGYSMHTYGLPEYTYGAYGFPIPYQLDVYMYGYPFSIFAFAIDLCFYILTISLFYFGLQIFLKFNFNKIISIVLWTASGLLFGRLIIEVIMFSDFKQFGFIKLD